MGLKKKAKEDNPKIDSAPRKRLVSDILKTVENLQEKADRKLQEISYMCMKEQSNGK